MEILFFVLIIVLFLVGSGLNEKEQREKNRNLPIKCHEYDAAHDWTYHPETKKLTCTLCGYEAGSDNDESK